MKREIEEMLDRREMSETPAAPGRLSEAILPLQLALERSASSSR